MKKILFILIFSVLILGFSQNAYASVSDGNWWNGCQSAVSKAVSFLSDKIGIPLAYAQACNWVADPVCINVPPFKARTTFSWPSYSSGSSQCPNPSPIFTLTVTGTGGGTFNLTGTSKVVDLNPAEPYTWTVSVDDFYNPFNAYGFCPSITILPAPPGPQPFTTPVCAPPTVDIKASQLPGIPASDGPITIPYNTSASLTWTSTNANACTASGDWSGAKSASSSGAPTDYSHFWKMDEASGSLVADSAGTNNGTAVGTTIVPGRFGNARDLVGGINHINTGNIASTPAGTMTAWIKPVGAYGGIQAVMVGNNAAGLNQTARYAIWVVHPGICPSGDWGTMLGNDSTWQFVCSGQVYNSTNFPAGVWAHLAITYDGSNVRFYRDGVLIRTVPQTISFVGSAQPFTLGDAGGFSGYNFNGVIDEEGIWPRALLDTEIFALYNPGAPYDTGPLTSSKNYTLTCQNTVGSASDSVAVNVAVALPGDFTLSQGALQCNSVGLNWTASAGAVGYRVLRGSPRVTIADTPALAYTDYTAAQNTTYIYQIEAYNSSGTNRSNEKNVTTPYCPPTVDLKCNGSDGPIDVPTGNTCNLSWTVGGGTATSCTASGNWSGSKSTTGGSETSAPLVGPSQATFNLTCVGPGGSSAPLDSVPVNVVGFPLPSWMEIIPQP